MSYIIKTKRCLLRAFVCDDAKGLYTLNNDHDVIKYTGDGPFKSIKEAEDFILGYDQYQKFGMGRWACILQEDKNFIGWCGLKYNTDIDKVDIGFRFLRKYWNQGLAFECALACIEYGFDRLNLESMIARSRADNTASLKLIDKLGLKYDTDIIMDGHPGKQFTISKNKSIATNHCEI